MRTRVVLDDLFVKVCNGGNEGEDEEKRKLKAAAVARQPRPG